MPNARCPFWKCDECGKEMNELSVHWGISAGQKVDILEYFCLYCPSTELTFQGTKEERDTWWKKRWEEKP